MMLLTLMMKTMMKKSLTSETSSEIIAATMRI